ncbi:class I SAM-dependent methyltransferase [Rhodopila sp.]|jgi:hypothetical protein|uniref:class I SAM-dependent methyltransferase n=1 Tax=Rhodopila sp. TaxID=2480087 RepID=UPI002CE74AAD|nr:class I SAM-dependent methyltransferase [Rhodopila sp.]HVZ08376.1 class I SAM-dependent methyltransferase [Rhodopila sp.]
MLTEPEVQALPTPLRAPPACRLCGARLDRTVLDLGRVPVAIGTSAFGAQDRLCRLHVQVCESCLLVQLPAPAILPQAATPFPSSSGAEDQARRLARALTQRLGLHETSLAIEITDTQPEFLPHFQTMGVPVLTQTSGFNAATAMELAARAGRADVVLARNVLPGVADLFDFAAGFAALLRPKGVVVLQVPHLLPIIQGVQFDAFRPDRRFYLSLRVIEQLLRSVGLRVFDAEKLPDDGGSLRVYACHPRASHTARPALKAVRAAESAAGLDRPEGYDGFAARVAVARDDVRDFLATRRAAGRRVAAYGLANRGTALLNACGIGPTQVAWVADPDGTAKGRYLPGSGIPVVSVEALTEDRPGDLLILPWPRAAELAAGLQTLRQKGTLFWIMTPAIRRV